VAHCGRDRARSLLLFNNRCFAAECSLVPPALLAQSKIELQVWFTVNCCMMQDTPLHESSTLCCSPFYCTVHSWPTTVVVLNSTAR
jgi:hypothetical protein